MNTSSKYIILSNEKCLIYPNKNKCLAQICFSYVAAFIICAVIFLLPTTSIYIWLVILFVVLGNSYISYSLWHWLKTNKNPIILTNNTMSLPDGQSIYWNEIKEINFITGRPAIRCAIIMNKRNIHVNIENWNLYGSMKTLSKLFNNYAQREICRFIF